MSCSLYLLARSCTLRIAQVRRNNLRERKPVYRRLKFNGTLWPLVFWMILFFRPIPVYKYDVSFGYCQIVIFDNTSNSLFNTEKTAEFPNIQYFFSWSAHLLTGKESISWRVAKVYIFILRVAAWSGILIALFWPVLQDGIENTKKMTTLVRLARLARECYRQECGSLARPSAQIGPKIHLKRRSFTSKSAP